MRVGLHNRFTGLSERGFIEGPVRERPVIDQNFQRVG